MFRIMQDPSSGSIDWYLIKTTHNGSTVLVVCAVGLWRHIQDLWCVCALQTPTAHTTSTVEPLRVVLIKYQSILPDDGSCVIRNMLE
jgi:hypothetical protein